jgi:hypothetical protein
MILACPIELTVGRRFVAPYVHDAEGKLHFNVPMLVLREATMEEWAAQDHKYSNLKLGDRFYMVSVD